MVFSFASHGCLGLINTLCRCAFWDSACLSAGPGTSGYSDGAAGGFVGAGAGRRRHPGDHSHSSSSAVGVRGLSAFAGVLFPSVVGIRRRPPPAMARSQDPAALARHPCPQHTAPGDGSTGHCAGAFSTASPWKTPRLSRAAGL